MQSWTTTTKQVTLHFTSSVRFHVNASCCCCCRRTSQSRSRRQPHRSRNVSSTFWAYCMLNACRNIILNNLPTDRAEPSKRIRCVTVGNNFRQRQKRVNHHHRKVVYSMPLWTDYVHEISSGMPLKASNCRGEMQGFSSGLSSGAMSQQAARSRFCWFQPDTRSIVYRVHVTKTPFYSDARHKKTQERVEQTLAKRMKNNAQIWLLSAIIQLPVIKWL